MNTTFKSHELNRLISDFCNGTSSEADVRRLDTLLEGDESARQIYNNYMFLHAALYADHACIPLDDDRPGASNSAPGNDRQVVRPSLGGIQNSLEQSHFVDRTRGLIHRHRSG